MKTTLATQLGQQLHLTPALLQSIRLLQLNGMQLEQEIRQALEHNEQVKLSGFGNFDLRDKRQRPGRNPKTGEEIPITARRVVTFRPGQKLKARVEAYAGTKS